MITAHNYEMSGNNQNFTFHSLHKIKTALHLLQWHQRNLVARIIPNLLKVSTKC